MGSYCSVLNITEDVWSVKLGPDEAAINIATITGTVVATVAGAVALAGALAAPLTASLAANGVVSVFGVSTALLSQESILLPRSPSKLSASFKTSSTENWAWTALLQARRRHMGKCHCRCGSSACASEVVSPDNNQEILVERVYMRPIFSGALDNSELTHDIQWWINKNGVELLGQKIRVLS